MSTRSASARGNAWRYRFGKFLGRRRAEIAATAIVAASLVGGLGFAIPGAVGLSLALPDRPIAVMVGDGSAMYSIQGLWSAAHLGLPITYVIANNRSYRIIKERLVGFRKSDRFTGMDLRDPEIDFVALAQSMGLAARRVARPEDLSSALKEAMQLGKPSLLDVRVADGFGT